MRMPRSHAWSLVLVPFVLAACTAPDTAEDTDVAEETATPAATPPAATPPAEPSTFMAQIVPVGESGASGQVELRTVGQDTELRVTLNGVPEGVHQGHIHAGTCEAPGDVVTPLQPITTDANSTGEATSTVTIPMTTVMDGSHIVLYHEAGGEPGAPVACAAIPAHQI